MQILLTCEHAVNTIPNDFQPAYAAHHNLLNTHRGYDLGEQDIARHLTQHLHMPYLDADVSRLLIDYNRSLSNRHCLSFISKAFDAPTKEKLAHTYYLPYRQRVFDTLESLIKASSEPILHLAIHSFTPVFKEITRTADLGFLYDPSRPLEKQIAATWCQWLSQQTHPLNIAVLSLFRHIRRPHHHLPQTFWP